MLNPNHLIKHGQVIYLLIVPANKRFFTLQLILGMPPSGNRYTLQPSVPTPHPILINHNDQQQQQPPQLVKQQPKTNSISIEKISASQQDFTIHRRLLSNGPPSNQSQQQNQGQIVFAPGQIVYPEYIAQNRDFPNK